MTVLAESTIRTYLNTLSRWYIFSNSKKRTKWEKTKLQKTIIRFINDMDKNDIAPQTIRKELSALKWKYGKRADSTAIKNRMSYLERRKGRPAKKASAIGVEELTAMVMKCELQRDRAILCVGWAGALRANEIVKIKRSDLTLTSDGFELLIPRSKTDQTGKGKTIALPYYHVSHMQICPVRTLENYLLRQGLLFDSLPENDFIFPVSERTIGRIIAKAAIAAYLGTSYTTHSLRRGLATTAAKNGIDDRTIMRHGRWTSRESVDGYIDAGTLWSRTALDFLR